MCVATIVSPLIAEELFKSQPPERAACDWDVTDDDLFSALDVLIHNWEGTDPQERPNTSVLDGRSG